MAQPQRKGTRITINGEPFRIVHVGAADVENAKFFGKRRFEVQSVLTGERFYTYGKRLMHNSRLVALSDS